jgi:cobalamin biosynthetic protein CobC
MAFPDAPLPWVDLSTGINPRPYPVRRSGWAEARRLPQREDTLALETIAAANFGVPDVGCIAAVPGSEIGLRLLPRILGADRVTIGGPTYGSHQETWAEAGARVTIVPVTEIGQADSAVIVVASPNNPDGRITPPEMLRALAARQADRGGWLVVDEAFADLDPTHSVAGHAGGALVVLRSFGKFYGLPGVRLGFILAAPAIVENVRALLGDWPVSAAAIAAGMAAYADLDWAARMRVHLARQAVRLDQLLARAGMDVVGGTDLFRLGRCSDGEILFAELARHGVLVRPFSQDRHLLRFGLPGSPSEWRRLEAALMTGRNDG